MDKWLQDGRIIKEGEQPAKHVKKRQRPVEKKKPSSVLYPQMDDHSNSNSNSNNNNNNNINANDKEDEKSSLYGYWQTEPYKPGVAENVSYNTVRTHTVLLHTDQYSYTYRVSSRRTLLEMSIYSNRRCCQ